MGEAKVRNSKQSGKLSVTVIQTHDRDTNKWPPHQYRQTIIKVISPAIKKLPRPLETLHALRQGRSQSHKKENEGKKGEIFVCFAGLCLK